MPHELLSYGLVLSPSCGRTRMYRMYIHVLIPYMYKCMCSCTLSPCYVIVYL